MTHAPPGPAPLSLESRSARGRRWLITAHADSSRDTEPRRLVRSGAGCMMLIEVRDHATGGTPQVTVQAGAAGRSTLASKIRGWEGDATGLEHRLKDGEDIGRRLWRRWWALR